MMKTITLIAVTCLICACKYGQAQPSSNTKDNNDVLSDTNQQQMITLLDNIHLNQQQLMTKLETGYRGN